MKTATVVGVRELRARLSAYLRSVSRGVSITIGNRRKQPIARLVPVTRSPESELLDRLAEGGSLRRGVGKPGRSSRAKPRKARPLLSDVLIEDRG